ncbi:hypothetical protein CRG98_029688 [Punica granatum]|uniref:Uncharacterized protein n=1 Tax=Punica granatum TaxID=22663 RepID=A0A2I0J0Y9_PUNGR|nr:hypothetical protein CRG98_029688 [Punica granatum]
MVHSGSRSLCTDDQRDRWWWHDVNRRLSQYANWFTIPSSAMKRTRSMKLDDVCAVGGGKCTKGAPEYAIDTATGVGGGIACIGGV